LAALTIEPWSFRRQGKMLETDEQRQLWYRLRVCWILQPSICGIAAPWQMITDLTILMICLTYIERPGGIGAGHALVNLPKVKSSD